MKPGDLGLIALLPLPAALAMGGGVGYPVGVGAGALSVLSLWLITGFAARTAAGIHLSPPRERLTGWDAMDESPRPEGATPESGRPGDVRRATTTLLLAFVLKAPILVAIALGAQSLGTAGLNWCVAGVLLVYFLAVFWAAARTNRL